MIESMRSTASDGPVAWCVCVTRLRSAETAERVEVLFGVETLGDGSHCTQRTLRYGGRAVF